MLRKPASVLLLSTGLAMFSMSTQAIEPGPYFGAGIGATDDEILQESDNGFRVFGGINITPNIGLEVAYVDLGDYVNGTITQEGVTYEIVGYLPISRTADLYGKFGIFDWEVSDGVFTNEGDDTTYAIGVNVKMSPNLNLRGEWQTYLDVDGGDVDMLSVNISVNF